MGDSFSDFHYFDWNHFYSVSASYDYGGNLYSTDRNFNDGYLLSTPIHLKDVSELENLREKNTGLVDFHCFVVDNYDDDNARIVDINGFYIEDDLYYYSTEVVDTSANFYDEKYEITKDSVIVSYSPSPEEFSLVYVFVLLFSELLFFYITRDS